MYEQGWLIWSLSPLGRLIRQTYDVAGGGNIMGGQGWLAARFEANRGRLRGLIVYSVLLAVAEAMERSPL